ncbi:MAG: L,D-transpeptidase family protein [Chromatiales bacterium]|nr:L,D-transpeptidase family protein [Chromatiales bacterium]MDH4014835.1 L,D-transpeptidase family protein [Chromatiales bacterium]
MLGSALYRVLAIFLVILAAPPLQAAAEADIGNRIIDTLESWRGGGQSVMIAAPVVGAFYASRGYRPAWSDGRNRDDMIASIHGAAAAGLNPDEYHLREIERLVKGDGSAAVQAELDILLTDALFVLGYHYRFGKVDPESVNPHWNIPNRFGEEDPVALVSSALDRHAVPELLARLEPKHNFYQRLKTALADYRSLQLAGGWPEIPEGETLRLGADDSRVVLLRRRLLLTRDLQQGAADSSVFDADVDRAVRVFQYRMGLSDDGVVGKDTLAALNVPVETRIQQIRINLERARWILHDLDAHAVVVNVAGFMAYVTEGEEVTWMTRVQVGKPYHMTPLFRDEVSYIEINPTWTVPYSISSKELLPKIKKDPDYLADRNMIVLDRNGKQVDPAGIDWNSLSANRFPYTLRQQPGPDNALGRIKFMFPNEHAVYLHDTPSKSLFERDYRVFSHGCIRVQNPYLLAQILLDDNEKWSVEKIEAAVDSRVTQRIVLDRKIPIYLTYWTAAVDDDLEVNFSRDPYNRDGRVLAGLDKPFVAPERVRERASQISGNESGNR